MELFNLEICEAALMVKTTTHLFMGVTLALMAPTVASAADLPLDPPVFEEVIVEEAPQQFDWTGFYIGAFIGYGWSGDDAVSTGNAPFLALAPTFVPNSLDVQSNGLLGGLNAGYNQRINQFVLGVEGDIALTDMSGSDEFTGASTNFGGLPTSAVTTRASRKYEYFGTLRGRLGFLPSERLMVFGTAGLAFSQVSTDSSVTSVLNPTLAWAGADDSFKFGWTAGAGAEYMATERLSIKLDGLYFDLENSRTTATPNAAAAAFGGGAINYENEIDNTGFVGRLGVNYHF
ncbi:MAG: outer membrane protein [Stappiaceae bacterium]